MGQQASLTIVLICNTRNTMTSIASLFPAFPKQMSVLDRVNIIVCRHKNNYFKEWSTEQLDAAGIDDITRPLQPITSDIYSANVKKNELTRNKKLQYCLDQGTSDNPPTWATDFIRDLQTDVINGVTSAKDTATTLWRQHSSLYDSKRAVQMPSSQPNGHAVKRKRQSNETEYQYRKRVHTENEQEQTEEDDDISDDPNIEMALSIRTSLKYIQMYCHSKRINYSRKNTKTS